MLPSFVKLPMTMMGCSPEIISPLGFNNPFGNLITLESQMALGGIPS